MTSPSSLNNLFYRVVTHFIRLYLRTSSSIDFLVRSDVSWNYLNIIGWYTGGWYMTNVVVVSLKYFSKRSWNCFWLKIYYGSLPLQYEGTVVLSAINQQIKHRNKVEAYQNVIKTLFYYSIFIIHLHYFGSWVSFVSLPCKN